MSLDDFDAIAQPKGDLVNGRARARVEAGKGVAHGEHFGHRFPLVFGPEAYLLTQAIDHLGVPKNLAAPVQTPHLKGQWTRGLFV